MPSSSIASRGPWVSAWEPIATPPASRARTSSGETRRWLLLPSLKQKASGSVVTNSTAGKPSSRRIGSARSWTLTQPSSKVMQTGFGGSGTPRSTKSSTAASGTGW